MLQLPLHHRTTWRASAVMAAWVTLSLWAGVAQARQMPLPTGLNNKPADEMPAEFVDIGIEDKAGQTVPADVRLVDADGRQVELGSYFDGKRPVVLVMAYYSCPMLCTLVLNAANDSLKKVAWTAGQEYRIVTVSIDPRDTPEIARGKQDSYVKEYGRAVSDDAWTFLTGEESEIKRLAEAVGFNYRWDEPTQQYVHAAGAFVLTPDGRVSRTLYGLEFNPRDVRLAITEASSGQVGTAVDKMLLFCFHYDPQAKGYVMAATRLMRAGGVLTVLLLGLWMGRFWRRERLRATSPQEL